MNPNTLMRVYFAAVVVIVALLVAIITSSSNTSSQNTELTQMLMTIKADQERLLTQNEELMAFKKSLTEAICPKVEPVVVAPTDVPVLPETGQQPATEAETPSVISDRPVSLGNPMDPERTEQTDEPK